MRERVELRGVSLDYGEHQVLRGVDLRVESGEFVALLGRSGGGKTTLLRVLAGLETPQEGDAAIPRARAVVFQEHRLLPWKRVWQNVAIGLGGSNLRDRAFAALASVELEHRDDAWPATLSGGESQRAGLARALVREPELLLLDEPFASLDALTRLHVQALVSRLWLAHRPSVLLVTHDVDEALTLADRVLVLSGGRIVADHRIDAPRPRDNAEPSLRDLRRCLLSALGVAAPATVPAAALVAIP